MASTITAGNATNGLALSCDNTGILELKTGTGSGTTAITADASQVVTAASNMIVNGNVGIGTSSPSSKLQINQATTGTYFRANASTADRPLTLTTTTTTNNGDTHTLNIDSSTGIFSIAIDSIPRARVTSGGNFGVGTTTPGASYSELVNFTATATNQPSLTLLNTNGSFVNDVFQIRSANTSANGNSWNMITGWSSTTSLNFLVRGNGNVLNSNSSYGSLSDQRIKENIVDATPKLENLKQVRVVNFNLIGDEQKQIGVVAQELEQVFPGMVEEDSGGMKAVKYSVFVPMLIKAIQEQQQMIETLQAKVAALEAK